VIADPPVDTGATHETNTCASPGEPAAAVGAPATAAPAGTVHDWPAMAAATTSPLTSDAATMRRAALITRGAPEYALPTIAPPVGRATTATAEIAQTHSG
jgi:hypothetical protein